MDLEANALGLKSSSSASSQGHLSKWHYPPGFFPSCFLIHCRVGIIVPVCEIGAHGSVDDSLRMGWVCGVAGPGGSQLTVSPCGAPCEGCHGPGQGSTSPSLEMRQTQVLGARQQTGWMPGGAGQACDHCVDGSSVHVLCWAGALPVLEPPQSSAQAPCLLLAFE